MTRQLHGADERTESLSLFAADKAELISTYLRCDDDDKLTAFDENMLDVDILTDGRHHFGGWHATEATPVVRFLLSTGGPGTQWELALDWDGRNWKLYRAAYVYMPWFGWDTHFIRQGSRTWQALENMLTNWESILYGDNVSEAYEIES